MEEQAPAPAEQSSISEAPAEAQVAEQPQEAQAEAPKPAEKPASRREALEKAFAKVDEGATDKAEAPDKPGPERGPDGKFVAKDGQEPAKADDAATKAQKPQDTQDAGKSPLSEAPARFSADAKAAWAQAPEAVRGEIKRAITELEGGLRQYQQVVEPLKPYLEMAKQHDVNFHEAVGNYVRMEQLLAKDMRLGLSAIAQNFGLTLDQMIAQAQGKEAPTADAKDREILTLKQELAAIKGQVGQVSQTMQQQREAQVLSEVEAFAQAHPRFEELADEIAQLLKTGYAADLADAYAKAERLNPAPPSATPATAQPPQPRPSRSVTGAPNAGSNPGNRQPSQSRTEAIARGMRAAGLM